MSSSYSSVPTRPTQAEDLIPTRIDDEQKRRDFYRLIRKSTGEAECNFRCADVLAAFLDNKKSNNWEHWDLRVIRHNKKFYIQPTCKANPMTHTVSKSELDNIIKNGASNWNGTIPRCSSTINSGSGMVRLHDDLYLNTVHWFPEAALNQSIHVRSPQISGLFDSAHRYVEGGVPPFRSGP
jgi:hypothetical protein